MFCPPHNLFPNLETMFCRNGLACRPAFADLVDCTRLPISPPTFPDRATHIRAWTLTQPFGLSNPTFTASRFSFARHDLGMYTEAGLDKTVKDLRLERRTNLGFIVCWKQGIFVNMLFLAFDSAYVHYVLTAFAGELRLLNCDG